MGQTTVVHPAAAAELLSALITAPDLPGAACVAERDLSDACLERQAGRAYGSVYARAIRICARCPALAPCAAWVDSLPLNERPFGVTAGRVRHRERTPCPPLQP